MVVLTAAVLSAGVIAHPVWFLGGAADSPGTAEAATAAEPLDRVAAGHMCTGDFVRRRGNDDVVARQNMAGRLVLPNFEPTPLSEDPTWREDAYGDAKWNFQYHAWEWLDRLRRVGVAQNDQAMLDRWQFLMRDWLADVRPGPDALVESWGAMAVGMRAIVLSCAVAQLGAQDWLIDAVTAHGDALADPAQYAGYGNHAMHQNNGLLALAVVAGRDDWRDLALSRNEALLAQAVDEQGVTDEGSLTYQWSNYLWWSDARARIRAAGLPVPPIYDRIDRMPDLVTYGTAPDGLPELLGDSTYRPLGSIRGTPSQYAATKGETGPEPPYLTRVFKAGYAIGRSSWDWVDFRDATFWTMRFGPALEKQVHGHVDQGSVTLSAYGSRLLWDQGLYAFNGGPMRSYVRSAAAHNAVTVRGASVDRAAEAPLLEFEDTDTHTLLTVEVRSQRGSTWLRTLFYSKGGRYLIIDDHVSHHDRKARAVAQRFHLGADRDVQVFPGGASTSGSGANVAFLGIGASPERKVLRGETQPLMGWRSLTYREAVPVPVLESRLTGAAVRFTTVVLPRPGLSDPADYRISEASRRTGGVVVTVHAGDVVEKVVLSGSRAEVTAAAVTSRQTPLRSLKD